MAGEGIPTYTCGKGMPTYGALTNPVPATTDEDANNIPLAVMLPTTLAVIVEDCANSVPEAERYNLTVAEVVALPSKRSAEIVSIVLSDVPSAVLLPSIRIPDPLTILSAVEATVLRASSRIPKPTTVRPAIPSTVEL